MIRTSTFLRPLAVAISVLALRLVAEPEPPGKLAPIRLGFSSEGLVELNESDARAALKIWAQTLGREVDIPFDNAISIYSNLEEIRSAMQRQEVDAVTLTTPEFWALRKTMPIGPFLLGRVHGEITEQYVLLVHQNNPAQRVADLRGKSIIILQGSRSSLIKAWRETLLLKDRLGPLNSFWGRTTHASKLTSVILPVFFRQADACIVTIDGFRTMSELNPQVGRQLRILAQSPEVVTNVFCFCGDDGPRHAQKVIAQCTRISETPTGRQVLALFQADKLMEGHLAEMETAFSLLDHHQRLLAEATQQTQAAEANPAPPNPPPGQP